MMKATREMSSAPSRLLRWQWATVALMDAGYAGYYLCRSNLSVCIPLIRDDLDADVHGVGIRDLTAVIVGHRC